MPPPYATRDESPTDGCPFVSVIIAVYNNAKGLRKCLTSLERQTFPRRSFEIIVIDNGSTEDLASVVAELPHVRFEQELTPGSYAARNRGITLATGTHFAFIDSDIIADRNWLERGLFALGDDPTIGLVGGRVDFLFADPQNPSAVELYDSITSFNQRHYIEHIGFSGAGNLFTRRDVLDAVGPFNPLLKSGGDLEWGQRVARAGFRLVYANDALVFHPARKSLEEFVAKARRVAGGHYAVRGRSQEGLLRFAGRCLRECLPPLRKLAGVAIDPRVPGTANRFKVGGITYLLNLVRVFETVRLRFGAESRR